MNTGPVNLLALDGGGIRGVSELLILDEIMSRLQHDLALTELPRPCEYFHLIGGTSTGGLVALMLGRLRMDTKEALEQYNTVAGNIFSKKNKKWKTQDGTFKASTLEAEMKRVVARPSGDAELMMIDESLADGLGRVVVLAMAATNLEFPRLFRSYRVRENQGINCRIWEVARATTAAPTFFKRISIAEPGQVAEYFLDAGIKCNNPVEEVIEEARLIFGDERHVGCIVSLGTGHPGTIGLAKPDAFQRILPLKLVDTLKKIATNCEEVANRLSRKFVDCPDIYYRFNVTHGAGVISLEEWEKMDEVVGHTKAYLQSAMVSKAIDSVVRVLLEQQRAGTLARLGTVALGQICGSLPTLLPNMISSTKLISVPGSEQKIVLDKLQSADNAAYDSYDEQHNAKCYPGTRVELLRQIDTWASNRDSEHIFWLNGMAGTGKSTISRTVAQKFTDKGDLGASFFFKRGEGDRGHAKFLITTIITQLVEKLPSLAPHVQNAIDTDPGISKRALKQQFDILVLQPLGKIQSDYQKSSSIIIVIDALDECDREEDVKIIIHLFSQVKHIISVQPKFFLTSRPELPIRLGFENIRGKYKGLALHQIPEPIVKEDISTFLKHELAMIQEDYNKLVPQIRQLPAGWPGHTNMQSLIEMAIPLFIFATTVCRFINDRKCGQPNDQLAKVLKYQTKSQASKLDATYLPVLNQLLVGVTESEKRGIVEEFQQIVGSIVILASPLSATSLDRLLGLQEGTVDGRIDLLHSVLSIPSCPDDPIRLLHLSFRDFLVDVEKREINPFWVEEKQAHQRIAVNSIHLMSTFLKKDICDLEFPGMLITDVASSRVKKCLTPEVGYACLYWIEHLQKSGAQLRDNGEVHQFLELHFLHWLEAIGWIRRTSEALVAIASLETLVAANESSNLHSFIKDAKRFALYNRSVIEKTPLQLYFSALIFAPENSIVKIQFKKDILPWIQMRSKLRADWSATLQTLEGHSHEVKSVVFSPDGKIVASGSDDQTVRLWDASTGTPLQTLEGHSNWVYSVAFSPDGKMVASGSRDQTVRLWDASTGTPLQTLEGHSDTVYSVAFSPDGKVVASGSYDQTVQLWDASTGTLLQTLEGQSDTVYSVAFSPDGKMVASGSYDQTVQLWDVSTGTLLQTLEGHSRWVNSVAFSPVGKMVASGSGDQTVRLWDASTGTPLQTLEGHSGGVYSVTFSPDGKMVASGSVDKTVRLWDASTGTLLQTLEGHSRWVNSVAFSPDGKMVASGSGDKTVRLWDASTGTLLQTLEGQSDTVYSVAFSPDGKVVASGSDDQTVRLWDASTGTLLQTLEGHSGEVNSVAFSPDGKVVASGSGDQTVQLWDASTGTLLQTLEDHSREVYSVAFSPDGKMVASGSYDQTVQLWDVSTGTPLQTLEGHSGGVNSVTFSPDGKMVASGSVDKTVRLWDASTGTPLQRLEGQSDTVYSVAFSPDGKVVASGSDDKTVQLWDASTGTPLQTLEGHSGEVNSIAFSLHSLTVLDNWVVKDKKNIIWLPPDYRLESVAVWNQTIVIGHSSGGISILQLE